jgi:serine/threonine protein phosphatase 1
MLVSFVVAFYSTRSTSTVFMHLPALIEYPIIAIGDLHGQLPWLDKLQAKLEKRPEWPAARLVFLGDFVDRGPAVKELVTRVLELIAAKPGSTAMMGNHDLALVSAAGLNDAPPPEYWVERYRTHYDHHATFRSYLGRNPAGSWADDLAALKAAMPPEHRSFLANLPWVAEALGHLFLHGGLSPELDCPATVQVAFLHRKRWDRRDVNPRLGTNTDRLFSPDYPVWLGADKKLSANPLKHPTKVQVTGHVKVDTPDVNATRIRIDTSGGEREPLTACLLRGPNEPPEFVFS